MGGVSNMEQHQAAATSRDHFIADAQKELAAAERREREFSKKERQERAAQLHLPVPAKAA
jgi:hypothetical protein